MPAPRTPGQILEIKGAADAQDAAKHQAARRWVDAVNRWGKLGRWDFAVCRDPQELPMQIALLLSGDVPDRGP
jgi:type III restriction enzyme